MVEEISAEDAKMIEESLDGFRGYLEKEIKIIMAKAGEAEERDLYELMNKTVKKIQVTAENALPFPERDPEAKRKYPNERLRQFHAMNLRFFGQMGKTLQESTGSLRPRSDSEKIVIKKLETLYFWFQAKSRGQRVIK